MARTKTGNSQIDAIRKLMADGQTRTIDQVAKALKIARPNVSVALANGVKSGDFERVSTGVYKAADTPNDWEPLNVGSDNGAAPAQDGNVLDQIVEGMKKPTSVFATDSTEPEVEVSVTPAAPASPRSTAAVVDEASESAVGEQVTLTIIANVGDTEVLQDAEGNLWRLVALRLADA